MALSKGIGTGKYPESHCRSTQKGQQGGVRKSEERCCGWSLGEGRSELSYKDPSYGVGETSRHESVMLKRGTCVSSRAAGQLGRNVPAITTERREGQELIPKTLRIFVVGGEGFCKD